MEKIHIQIILEVLGRPAENVQQALASVVTKLAGEKGVKVLERTFHDPALVPNSNDLYTAFVEVNLEIDSLEQYFSILFSYMPSHVELIYPERISLDNAALNQFANQVMHRLHNYDAVVKNVIVERDLLLKKIRAEAPHLLKSPAPQIATMPSHPEEKPSSPSESFSKNSKKKSKKNKKNKHSA